MQQVKTIIYKAMAFIMLACLVAGCSFDNFIARIKLVSQREPSCSLVNYLEGNCQEPSSVSVPPASPVAMHGSFSDQTAFEILYGPYDEKTKSVTWGPLNPPVSAEFNPFRNKQGITKLLFSKEANINGVTRHYFITKTVPNDAGAKFNCHECAPLIGGAVFIKQGNVWAIENQEKYITTIGSFGMSPVLIYLVDAMKDNLGVMFQGEDTYQNRTTLYTSLVVPYEKTLKEVLSVDLGENNYTVCGGKSEHCWGYKSKIIFNKNGASNYNDIEIFAKGSYLNSYGKINPLNEIDSYRFLDGEYKEQ